MGKDLRGSKLEKEFINNRMEHTVLDLLTNLEIENQNTRGTR